MEFSLKSTNTQDDFACSTAFSHRPKWGSNLVPLGLKSNALPLCHNASLSMMYCNQIIVCGRWLQRKSYRIFHLWPYFDGSDVTDCQWLRSLYMCQGVETLQSRCWHCKVKDSRARISIWLLWDFSGCLVLVINFPSFLIGWNVNDQSWNVFIMYDTHHYKVTGNNQ